MYNRLFEIIYLNKYIIYIKSYMVNNNKILYRTFIYKNINNNKIIFNSLGIKNGYRQINTFILKKGLNILNIYYYDNNWVNYIFLDEKVLNINTLINADKSFEIINLTNISTSKKPNITILERNLLCYYNLPQKNYFNISSKYVKNYGLENNLEDTSLENNLEDTSLENNLEDTSLENNLEDTSLENNLEDTSLENNLEDNLEDKLENILKFLNLKPTYLSNGCIKPVETQALNLTLSENDIKNISKQYNFIKLRFKISNIHNQRFILHFKINNKISGYQYNTYIIEKKTIVNKTFYILNSGWFHIYKFIWYIKNYNNKFIKFNFNEKLHSYNYNICIDIKI